MTEAGAASAGAVPLSMLEPYMDAKRLTRISELCPGAASVICGLFPFFTPGEGNIARYARGRDYHLELADRLGAAVRAMKADMPENSFVPFADVSPVPERAAAALSGAGILGKNGLIIIPEYGAYAVIGEIVTDVPVIAPDLPPRLCSGCGRCADACPTGALRIENGETVYDMNKCLSHITQKRGELSPLEEAAVAGAALAWGCDRCADACPMSKNASETYIAAFRSDLIYSLKAEDIAGLSARRFREKYAGRAFTWRGPGPLKRNLRLQSEIPADGTDNNTTTGESTR